jgi:hypothetical protein
MSRGFAHFAGCQTEGFCAALLCLVLETDPYASAALVGLVELSLGLEPGGLGALRGVRRLDRPEDTQTADLALAFLTREVFVLVRTRGQLNSPHAECSGESRTQPLLLGPTRLTNQLRAASRPALLWATLLHKLRASPNALTEQAVEHWENIVERTFGLNDAPFTGIDLAVQTVACLRELMRACAADVGERADEADLHLTGWTGNTARHEGWRWHGLSVPLAGPRGRRIGIYHYVEAPPENQYCEGTTWLELYTDDLNESFCFVEFNPTDLSAAALDAVRAAFFARWQDETERRSRG